VASFYGKKFHGKKTASGKPFDMNAFTCAHPSLPFGTPVLVQNSENGAQCQVIVTDRGPYVGNRCIDLSKAAANKLGITGLARVICKTGRYLANSMKDKDNLHPQVASQHKSQH
jgi:rare lipoprotein A